MMQMLQPHSQSQMTSMNHCLCHCMDLFQDVYNQMVQASQLMHPTVLEMVVECDLDGISVTKSKTTIKHYSPTATTAASIVNLKGFDGGL